VKSAYFRQKGLLVFGIVAVCAIGRLSAAQDQDGMHNELRNMRDEMMAAFQARDIDALLKHLHPNVVVTWQNAEVSRGRDGVRQFYQKMMEGEVSRVKNVTADLVVDELSIIFGDDTAIAFGTLNENFELRSGLSFNLANRWTATAVREQGQWQLVAFQVSTNMFENGLQDRLLQWNAIKSGGIALPVGVVVGLAIASVLRRRKQAVVR
jgi:ketosteroid isomerase-like protein